MLSIEKRLQLMGRVSDLMLNGSIQAYGFRVCGPRKMRIRVHLPKKDKNERMMRASEMRQAA